MSILPLSASKIWVSPVFFLLWRVNLYFASILPLSASKIWVSPVFFLLWRVNLYFADILSFSLTKKAQMLTGVGRLLCFFSQFYDRNIFSNSNGSMYSPSLYARIFPPEISSIRTICLSSPTRPNSNLISYKSIPFFSSSSFTTWPIC